MADSKTIDLLFTKTEYHLRQNYYDGAIEACNEILALDPTNSRAYYKRMLARLYCPDAVVLYSGWRYYLDEIAGNLDNRNTDGVRMDKAAYVGTPDYYAHLKDANPSLTNDPDFKLAWEYGTESQRAGYQQAEDFMREGRRLWLQIKNAKNLEQFFEEDVAGESNVVMILRTQEHLRLTTAQSIEQIAEWVKPVSLDFDVKAAIYNDLKNYLLALIYSDDNPNPNEILTFNSIFGLEYSVFDAYKYCRMEELYSSFFTTVPESFKWVVALDRQREDTNFTLSNLYISLFKSVGTSQIYADGSENEETEIRDRDLYLETLKNYIQKSSTDSFEGAACPPASSKPSEDQISCGASSTVEASNAPDTDDAQMSEYPQELAITINRIKEYCTDEQDYVLEETGLPTVHEVFLMDLGGFLIALTNPKHGISNDCRQFLLEVMGSEELVEKVIDYNTQRGRLTEKYWLKNPTPKVTVFAAEDKRAGLAVEACFYSLGKALIDRGLSSSKRVPESAVFCYVYNMMREYREKYAE